MKLHKLFRQDLDEVSHWSCGLTGEEPEMNYWLKYIAIVLTAQKEKGMQDRTFLQMNAMCALIHMDERIFANGKYFNCLVRALRGVVIMTNARRKVIRDTADDCLRWVMTGFLKQERLK